MGGLRLKYDFDTVVDRRNTGSLKWDGTAPPCKKAVIATLHSAARIRLIKCMISLAVCTLISRQVVLKLKKKRI